MISQRSLRRHLAATGLLILLLLGLHGTPKAAAQEPVCPPGFVWRRMSGVGCMQEDCLDIGQSKYTYTGACSCVDGYKGCYELVDYTGFDRDRCRPGCPVSVLVACVAPDAACPGEDPVVPPTVAPPTVAVPTVAAPTVAPPTLAAPTIAPPTAAPSLDVPATSAVAEATDSAASPSIDDLVHDLEEFLAGEDASGPGAGEAAAGAAAVSTLIGAWVLTNLLSGGNLADLLQAVGLWQQQRPDAPAPPQGPPAEPPAGDSGPADRSAAPSPPGPARPAQAAGESAEERIGRVGQDVHDYAQALEQSRQQLQQLVDRVPQAVRESENWQRRIAPHLEQVQGWTDPSKVLELTRRLEEVLRRRQEYEQSPAFNRLNAHQQEMLIWLTRGVDVLSRAAEEAHQRCVIDPATAAANRIPGKPGVKTLEQHGRDSAGLFEEVRRVVPRALENVDGASQRGQGLAPDYPGDPFQSDDLFRFPSPPPRTRETASDRIIRGVREWWNRPGKLPFSR